MSTWTLNKFCLQADDPDPDFNVIALNEFVDHLKSLKNGLLDLDVEQINIRLLPKVISRMSDNTPDTLNPAFRSTVLMSKVLPIPCLANLFNSVLDEVYKHESEVRAQILSIMREIITNAVSYDPERQREICNILLPRVDGEIKQARKEEDLLFSLDLLTYLVESLAFEMDVEEKKKVFEVIKEYASTNEYEVLQCVAAIAKFWAVSATPEQFEELMKFLLELKNRENAFLMLCSMVKFKPIVYEKYATVLLEMFLAEIDQEEANIAQLFEEQPETDLFADTHYIQHLTELLSSVSALVNTFREQGRPFLEKILGFVFAYLTYGSSASLHVESGVSGEDVEMEEDIEIEIDGDESSDEEDDVVMTGDDSWKIRKVSMGLAMILIDCYTDDFFEALSYSDEETNRMSMITLLIQDNDMGAQKDAFCLVQRLVHVYKEKLSDELVHSWFMALANQVVGEKLEILGLLLYTISAIIEDIESAPLDAMLFTLSRITPSASNQAISPYLLNLLQVVMKVSPGQAELIEPISRIFVTMLEKSNTTLPCLETISHFYRFLSGSPNSDPVNQLNQMVIGLARKDGEKKIAAISTLAVFVVCCAGYDSLPESLQVIVECRSSDACHKVLCGSVALIIATGHADLLAPHVPVLLEVIEKNIQNIDLSVQYRTLWALRLMLESKLADPSLFAGAVPSLVETLTRGDNRCKLLSLIILGILPDAAAKSLGAVSVCLLDTTGQISDDVVDEICKLMTTFSSYALDDVIKSLNDLYERGLKLKKDSVQVANIAKLLGYVGGHVNAYEQIALERFTGSIVASEKPEAIALLCTGEMGSYINLSENAALVDAIFNLALSNERSIFSAACHCIGGMASGSSQVIMPRLVKNVNEDHGHLAKWLLAILSFARKNVKTGKSLDDAAFNEVSECVLACANSVKEARQSVAESLALLGRMRPEFVDRLIDLSDPKEKGAIAMRAVAMYIEGSTADEILRLIDRIMAKVDVDQPEISEFVMQSLKSALRFNSLACDLIKYLPVACDCVQERPSHIQMISYGPKQTKIDVGYQFRLLATDCVLTFFREVPSLCKADELLRVVQTVLSESRPSEAKDKEKRSDIMERGLTILTEMAISPIVGAQTVDALPELSPTLVSLSQQLLPGGLEQAFLKMLVYVSLASEKKKNNDFEQLYSQFKAKFDVPMEKLRVELRYIVSSQDTKLQMLSNTIPLPVDYELMRAKRPEAASMFSRS